LYQDSVSLCSKADDEKWKKAVFMVFDAPSIADKPYEERMQYLKDLKELPSFVNIIDSVKCQGNTYSCLLM
jgi:uncharacterized membrane protein